MIVIDDKAHCFGCAACQAICPTQAISMKADLQGFSYPFVDVLRCIECEKCVRVCPFLGNQSQEEVKEVYALRSLEPSIRENSASGGAFTVFTDLILNCGGSVCGSIVDDETNIKHICSDNVNARNRMRGSKYVQSDISEIFESVSERIISEKKGILFSGTPCQCAALKSFLNCKKISTENLILCDLVCHGVTSPLIWKEFVGFIERKYRAEIKAIYFRSQRRGWYIYDFRIELSNGSIIDTPYSYLPIMFSDCAMRPSCYSCPYTNLRRVGDISIGDFFGIESENPDWLDELGVSLVLLDSEKGKELFSQLDKNQIETLKCSKEELKQQALNRNLRKPEYYDNFWRDFNSFSADSFMERYARVSLGQRIKDLIKTVMLKTHTFRFLTKYIIHYVG